MTGHPMWDLIDELEKRRTEALSPGAERSVEVQRARGKLLARERVGLLLDPGTFREIDMLVYPETSAPGMEDKKAVTDGIVAGWGKVDGRLVYVFAQDPTVVGGSLGEAGGAKVHKLMDLAAAAGAPIVGINDGGGARIQEGVVSLAAYGGVFLRNAKYSGVVPQISVIMGTSTGGAVYSPALTDFVFMVEGTSAMSITGPDVVKAATGEAVTVEELGGATAHATRSGVAHFVAADERGCLQEVRRLLGFLPSNNRSQPPSTASPAIERDLALVEVLPERADAPYDVRTVIERIVDGGELLEYSQRFATNIVCGFARIGGCSVGVVANQPLVLAGTLDINACEKAARFVRTCDAFNVPLVTFVDSPGFRPGADQEHGGLVRHGAKLLYAFCEATVPRVQVVLRKAYGAAYVTMASKTTGTHQCYAWPSAELAVMGPGAAVRLLFGAELGTAESPEARMAELLDDYTKEQINPYQAAARGYLDDVIHPADTRRVIADALASLAALEPAFAPRKHGNIPL